MNPVKPKLRFGNQTSDAILKEHWSRCRIKYLLKEIDKRTSTGTELLLSMRQGKGLVPHNDVSNKRFKSEDLIGYKIVCPGQLVMNRMRASIGLFAASHTEGLVSPDYAVFQPLQPVNLDYLVSLFRTSAIGAIFRQESKGMGTGSSGFLRLYTDRFGSISIQLPSLEGQSQIVALIRAKEKEITRFIRNRRRLIELLKEQKQNIINQAVTRGLNPNVNLKPSGVEWIEDIPEHWKVIKLRNLLKPISSKNRPSLPLLSVAREKGVLVRDVDNLEENRNFIPDDLSNYKVVLKGQFVINKMKAWQGSYGVSEYEGIVSPAYFVFALIGKLKPAFFHLAIRSKAYIPFFCKASDGIRIGQWDLSIPRMKGISFFMPTSDEQEEIVDFVREQHLVIDHAINRSEREIELMREYRTRLISDVVTGQVEVRGIEVPEIPEEELPELDEESIEQDDVIEDEGEKDETD